MEQQNVTPAVTSVARIQAIASYPAQMSLLNLYTEYDRASYLAEFGVQPPDEDPTKPYKLWFATDSPASISHWVKDPNTGSVSYTPITGVMDLASVNIPGYRTYPAWVNSPTSPAIQIFQNQIQAVPGNTLCLQSEAVEIASEIGGVLNGFGPQTYVWNGELRRPWQIQMPDGSGHNAATLAAMRWANGVGSPGSWSGSSNDPIWTPAPVKASGTNTSAHVPVPQRNVHLGEKVSVVFPGLMVVTLDNQPAATPDPAIASLQSSVDTALSLLAAILSKLSGGQ